MKIVEFANGKFAIKRYFWIFSEMLDNKGDDYFWFNKEYWHQHASFDSYQEALNAMNKYKQKKQLVKNNTKIVKVHKS